ncbi:nitroreductase [Sneathiella chinensis]|uniref:NADH dehydrogenase n=1 Tax=Sneathiella chinensis TaxID=349750 RepID=A0ABQ5U4A7_9PROT|nr:nitroreductase [Sneathiella chinensis]GLQ06749.1 NADH dehydrogenase [Sneathiella chinensis]
MKVTEAIKSRKSVRQFSDRPVSEQDLRDILETAKWAPSGGNLQPWKVQVLAGAPLQALVDDVRQKLMSNVQEEPEYHVYPPELTEPYRTRRRVVGQQLYELIGVPREDTPGKLRQLAKNFEFFGAPVGLFFVIDRQMEIGQFADMGMFMQNIMLLAREKGLHTCPQEAWARWPQTLIKHLDLPDNEMAFCGMALGYEDESAIINTLQSEREDFGTFITMNGF